MALNPPSTDAPETPSATDHLSSRELDNWDDLTWSHQEEILDHTEICTACDKLLADKGIGLEDEDEEEDDSEFEPVTPMKEGMLIEYALILALIAIVAIVALIFVINYYASIHPSLLTK